jgi:hypothetical protein
MFRRLPTREIYVYHYRTSIFKDVSASSAYLTFGCSSSVQSTWVESCPVNCRLVGMHGLGATAPCYLNSVNYIISTNEHVLYSLQTLWLTWMSIWILIWTSTSASMSKMSRSTSMKLGTYDQDSNPHLFVRLLRPLAQWTRKQCNCHSRSTHR